jgi:hypothetical protein
MSAKIQIIFYSMYGRHVTQITNALIAGRTATG